MSTADHSLFKRTCDVAAGFGFFPYFHTCTTTRWLGNTHTHTHVRAHVSVLTKKSAGILISFSPLPQHDHFGLSSTPLAEGEELVDEASCFAKELLGAELQLFVALVNSLLRLPEVLDGGRVEGVGSGKSSNKVLKLVWKAEEDANWELKTFPTGQTDPLTAFPHLAYLVKSN